MPADLPTAGNCRPVCLGVAAHLALADVVAKLAVGDEAEVALVQDLLLQIGVHQLRGGILRLQSALISILIESVSQCLCMLSWICRWQMSARARYSCSRLRP